MFLIYKTIVDIITGYASPYCPMQSSLHLLHTCQVAGRNLPQPSATGDGKIIALFPNQVRNLPWGMLCSTLDLVYSHRSSSIVKQQSQL